MAKKAASVRYDEYKLDLAKKETGQPSLQKVLNFFLDSVWFKHNPPKKIEFQSSLASIKDISTDGKIIGELNGLTGKYTPKEKSEVEPTYNSEWFKIKFNEAKDAKELEGLVNLMLKKIDGKWSQGQLKEVAQSIYNDKFNF